MKRQFLLSSGIVLALITTAAQAIEGGVEVGKHYTNLSVGAGTATPGLNLSGNWLRSDHDGATTGVRLGYNVEIGPVFLSPAVKLMWTDPDNGKAGIAGALGAGASYSLAPEIGLFGEYYYSPEAFTDHLDRYQEASCGVSFTPISLLTIRAGYKYVELDNKGNRRDNVLADGPWVGASLRF